MTSKAYHLEDAYKKITGKSAADDVDAYRLFTSNLMKNRQLVPFEVTIGLLWVIVDECGVWEKSWRYYPDDYGMSDDEYEEGIEDYEAEEGQLDLNLLGCAIVDNFVGVIK